MSRGPGEFLKTYSGGVCTARKCTGLESIFRTRKVARFRAHPDQRLQGVLALSVSVTCPMPLRSQSCPAANKSGNIAASVADLSLSITLCPIQVSFLRLLLWKWAGGRTSTYLPDPRLV